MNYSDILQKAKNPLVLAVGGGNDSVSTLLIQKQLQETFGYYPDKINIIAMLPDCLDYVGHIDTKHPLVKIITEDSQRYVQGKLMTAFPERILSQNKKIISTLPIENVYGILMNKGSIGVAQALSYVLSTQQFDLILAFDVGGDFIAIPENIDVLSPMMDSYMLYALSDLRKNNENFQKIPIIYGVFGLGTDGETTPELLYKALETIDYYEGTFAQKDVQEVIDFYRNTVEPNRYSRTTDFTMKEIQGIKHDNPAKFRGRFHVKTSLEEKSQVNYGVFEHYQDPYFFAKYYLFTDSSKIKNPFAIACINGIDWFINIQSQKNKINHELNGQSYNLKEIFPELNENKVLFFGTPSRKFNNQQQQEIAQQIALSIQNNVYDLALIYQEQVNQFSNVFMKEIGQSLVLIGKNESLLNDVHSKLNKYC